MARARSHDSDARGNEPELDRSLRGPQGACRRVASKAGSPWETICRPNDGAAPPVRVSFTGLKGDRSDAMRSVAGGPGFGIIGRRMEERALLELRLRHPIDDCGSGRRPARFRAAARALAHPMSPCAPARSRPSATAKDPSTEWKKAVLVPIGGDVPNNGD